MTLQEALNDLDLHERQELQLAFDDLRPHLLMLEDGFFLAVHFDHDATHDVIETQGYWSYGKVKCQSS